LVSVISMGTATMIRVGIQRTFAAHAAKKFRDDT
jgi:hypothetical protein